MHAGLSATCLTALTIRSRCAHAMWREAAYCGTFRRLCLLYSYLNTGLFASFTARLLLLLVTALSRVLTLKLLLDDPVHVLALCDTGCD
jgi:hypothetical protein